MKYLFTKIMFIILLFPIMGYSQKIIDIDYCYTKAQEHYPLASEYNIIALIRERNISNVNRSYLPQLELSSQLTYQSDVIGLPIEIPGLDIEKLNKEQYQIALNINQSVWDGGFIKAKKSLLNSEYDVDKERLNVRFYKLKAEINKYYFGAILLKEQVHQNGILQKMLNLNYKNIESYINTGFLEKSDLKKIEVEILKSEQKEEELKKMQDSYCQILSILVGEKIAPTDSLCKPLITNPNVELDINRPELKLFQREEDLIRNQKKIIIAKNRPNIGVFIQGAYGNPGLNLLKNESTPFFIAGIGLKWNIGNFYTLRNELRINKSKQLQLNIQKDLFLLNTKLEIIKEDNDIKEISNKIQKNQEIIVLRKEIREITEDKLINGMASVNDLIETIISEESAIQDKIISEINFLIYIYMRKQTINY